MSQRFPLDRALLDTLLDAVLIANDDRVYVDVNMASCELLGLPREKLIGMRLDDFLAPGVDGEAAWSAFLAAGTEKGEITLQTGRPGDVRQVEYSATANYRPGLHISVLRDVTERKLVEGEVQRLAKQVTSILDSTTDCVCSVDSDWQITYMNGHARASLVQGQDVTGQNLWEVFPEARRTNFYKNYINVAETREPMHFEEWYEPLRAWFDVHAYPLENGGLGIYFRDITEQKQLKDQLLQERERWRLVLAGNHDGIWDLNIRTGEVFFSSHWKNMLGFEEGELPNTYKTLSDRIHPKDRDRVLWRLTAYCTRKMDHYREEFRMQAKDGTYRWILARGQAVWSENGVPIRIVGSHSDITERRLAQEALKQSERYFRALIENALDIITILERDGTIRYESPSIQRVLGYDSKTLLGKCVFDFIHPTDKDRIRAIFERTIHYPMACEQVQLRFRHNDGSWRVLDAVTMNLLQDPTVRGFVVNSRDITDRQLAEERLRESESRLAAAQALAHIGNWESDLCSGETYWSEETYRIFGVPLGTEINRDDVLRMVVSDEDCKAVKAAWFRSIQDQTPYSVDYRILRPDGRVRFVVSHGEPIVENGQPVRMLGTTQDITDRKQLEEELRQAQKLQAIGRLAGGVAHDFNNLLTVILGYTNLVYRKLDEESPLRTKLAEVKQAGERAASITQQLLAFSRKQVLQPKVLNLNALVKNMGDFLQRLIGEDVALRMTLDPDLGSIKADATQVEQVVMNLAANARDAMPKGGELLLQTSNVDLDEKSANLRSLDVGSYVLLSVSDTGCGMDADTKANMFDPFFTTKEQGKGTGLGLAIVYGIVEQSKGGIVIHSELGQGSTIKIYLPRVSGNQTEDVQETPERMTAPAAGTILLIEDDSGIRRLAQEILEEAGYSVFAAGTGTEAIRIVETLDRRLNLIVSDVVIPGRSGPDTVKEIKCLAGTPTVPVLYTSGYTDHSQVTQAALAETPNCGFLHKPFVPASLLQAVKEILSVSSGN